MSHRGKELDAHDSVNKKLKEQQRPDIPQAGKRQQQGVEQLRHRFEPPHEPQNAAYPKGPDDRGNRPVTPTGHPEHDQSEVGADNYEDVKPVPRIDEVGLSKGKNLRHED